MTPINARRLVMKSNVHETHISQQGEGTSSMAVLKIEPDHYGTDWPELGRAILIDGG